MEWTLRGREKYENIVDKISRMQVTKYRSVVQNEVLKAWPVLGARSNALFHRFWRNRKMCLGYLLSVCMLLSASASKSLTPWNIKDVEHMFMRYVGSVTLCTEEFCIVGGGITFAVLRQYAASVQHFSYVNWERFSSNWVAC